MRTCLIIFLLINTLNFLTACENNSSTNSDDHDVTPEKWLMVWQDEFNTPQIDTNKWNFEFGAGGWGNNESQYYTNRSSNVFIQDSNLVIQALKENFQGSEYTSARLTTKNKGDWLYGRFEARAITPRGQGLWPAIWMLSTDWEYGDWAASGEIDIMELIGNDIFTVYGTLHYGGSWPANVQSGAPFKLLQTPSFADDYHTFAIEWDSTSIKWFVDDSLYQTQTSWYSDGVAFPAPFNKRFHLMLNVAVGGNWPGYPNSSTQFPQKMIIDYIRVYQLNPAYKGT